MHKAIRQAASEVDADFAKCAIVYGGSVTADNAASIASITDVTGVLVGGASLKAESIHAISVACGEARGTSA